MLDERPPLRPDRRRRRAGRTAPRPSHRRDDGAARGRRSTRGATSCCCSAGHPRSVRAEGGIARVWATTGGQHHRAARKSTTRRCCASESGQGGRLGKRHRQLSAGETRSSSTTRRWRSSSRSPPAATGWPKSSSSSKPGRRERRRRRAIRGAPAHDPRDRRRRQQEHAERLEPMLRNMAGAVGELSPETLIGLLAEPQRRRKKAPRLMDAIVSRMTDRTIAQFVSRNVIAATTADRSPGGRVPDAGQESETTAQRLLDLAHDDVADVSARQHRWLRSGVEPRRREAADLVLATNPSCRTSTRASCPARARGPWTSSRRATIRPNASRRGCQRRDDARCGRSTCAAARSPADRGQRRALGRADGAGDRAHRGPAARRRLRRAAKLMRRGHHRSGGRRSASQRTAGSTR